MSKNRGKKIVEEEEPEEEEEVEEEEEDEDEEEEEAPKAKPKAGSKATPAPKRTETKEEEEEEEDEDEEEEEDQSSRRGASAARGSGLTQILPYLYVGDANTCKRSDVLKGQGITHIVNCISNEVPSQHPDEFNYTEFEVDDDRNYKISQHFDETFEIFAGARDSGKQKVLVFCEKGTGPSCVLVLAYMLRSAKQKRKPLTLKAAHTYVKGKKPNMWINDGFLRQLINLEKELFGDSTMRVHNAGGKGRRGEKRTVKLDQ